MSKIKSYIMDVETFVDNYFDYDTETFKTNKEKILLVQQVNYIIQI